MAKITADHLAKLQQKADQHLARLQAAKARLAETERKMDTRRKIIAGGLLFDAAAKDKQWAHHLAALLARIDRPNDKEPFEGWSIEQYKAEGGKLGARKQARLEAAADDDEPLADETAAAGASAATVSQTEGPGRGLSPTSTERQATGASDETSAA